MVGKVYKITVVVLFVLDFLGAIKIWKALKEIARWGDGIEMVPIIAILVAGFIFCLLIYAVGEVISQLEISNSNRYAVYQMLNKKELPAVTRETVSTIKPVPAVTRTGDDGWLCKKWNTRNHSNALFCKGCGTYK